MFGGRQREAQVAERLQALEVRVTRLAAEVQSALQSLDRWEAKEVARIAALTEATDKLNRTAERARKTGALRGASDDGDSDADLDAFYDLYDRTRRT